MSGLKTPTETDNPTRAWALIPALLALATFVPALANARPADDAVILSNPLLAHWRTLPTALASPWWHTTGHLYRPLTLVTLGAEQLMTGGPLLSHAINIALNALIAALVMRVLFRLVTPAPAVMAGALFAVLPSHTEAVATLVGRAELLAALAIVSLILLILEDDLPTRGSRLAAAALSAAALASKESGVVAPIIALAVATTLVSQRRHALTWAIAAGQGTAVMLLARLAALGTLGGDLPHPAFRVASTAQRLALALSILPHDVAMLVLPIRPAIDWSPSLDELRHPPVYLVASGSVIVMVMLYALARHLSPIPPLEKPPLSRVLTLALTLLTLTALPTANLLFPTGVVMSGRVLYTPSIGMTIALAAALEWLRRAAVLRAPPRSSAVNAGAVVSLAALAVASTITSWRETHTWQDSSTMLATIAQRQPNDYRPEMYAAWSARDAGRPAESLAHFRNAAAKFPADAEMLTDGATVALAAHDSATAITWLNQALVANPNERRARARLDALMRRRAGS